jgi:hypothetical protein
MPLTDYSVVYNGLTIGAGTNFPILQIEGLGGTSPLRIQDDNRGYIDGSYSGRDFYDERTVYIDVLVLGSSSVTAQTNYKSLQTAFAPQPIGLYPDPNALTPYADQLKLFVYRLNTNTGDKQMYGRSRGLVTPIDADFTYGFIKTRIMMSFPDPRYYDNTATTVTGSSVSVVNAGWAISCPPIFLTTSATSGHITDGTTYMRFANMAVGQSLTVDLLSRIINYQTYPTRNILTAASNGWLQMEPLSTATWTSTIGSMTVVYRSAYI